MLASEPFPISFNRYRVLTWPPTRADRWRANLIAAMAALVLWRERGRGRRVLAGLDDHELRDIGVTRAQAQLESAKPFWMP
ncbi:MAG TPA: DUF1127 domain-containing protein [Candidatus Acidoferrum sp.]|nr:DUF1127 domain-containing protein [Candidatus Acidoferrum sp.]